ncbi:Gfo/Idh/MocA family oxidoreductase [Microbacterium betulae]|uniref:Gfo/Idh/MocA family oxidoreductase n=1 Tax=Microbacterium betulae TaxID=2981139 RepID=A0AA97FJC4_9MICO|nr:Gfo/Idh/MocA family oxidoreductase [Microbacterium sp. AB]WOF23345.1 Gfo/Idh/MocA family oxidoreductase [Microbacterium sp. AB]
MSGPEPVGVGFIGAGMISDTYLEHLGQFPDVKVVAVGDIDVVRAGAQAEKHGVPFSGTPDQILAHPDVELVVNLTIPAVHAEVSLAAIEAGKHVWSEKPIAVDYASGQELVSRAAEKGLRVGIAPDTVLGRGVQSALRAIARGEIGRPLGATTAMMSLGPDKWHPNPEFFFAAGAGPVFDMGPYYLTTLVNVFGSVARASAFGLTSTPTRTVRAGERTGAEFPVSVPTHVNANLEFVEGGTSQSVFSWESALTRMGVVEITGTEGTLSVPDPNMFEGPLRLLRAPTASNPKPEWEDLVSDGVVGGRGLGIVDLVRGIRSGRPHRASGDMGLHVLETMIAIDASVSTGQTVAVESRVERPAPIPAEWTPYAV